MSDTGGIPTFTGSPIQPSTATAGGPEDIAAAAQTSTSTGESTLDTLRSPVSTSATTTAAAAAAAVPSSGAYSLYPDARPGVNAPGPAPTGAAAAGGAATTTTTITQTPPPTRTIPDPTLSATTVSSASQQPPAPQPGSRPESFPNAKQAAAVPPPPKVGESIPRQGALNNSAATTATTATAAGPPSLAHQQQQYAIPNSTSTPYSSVYPHPHPQSTFLPASSLPTTGQATSTPGASSSTLPLHNTNPNYNYSYGYSYSQGGTHQQGLFEEEQESGILETAKSWLNSAGTKLAEVEKEVWKRINDVHE